MCPVMTGGQKATMKAAPVDERLLEVVLRPIQDLKLYSMMALAISVARMPSFSP